MKATADTALELIFTRKEHTIVPSEADYQKARDALAWAREFYGAIPSEKRTDFEHNLYVVARADVIPVRAAGIAAYIIAAYDRALLAKADSLDEHFMQPGDDFLERLTVVGYKAIDGFYGESYKYTFRTEAGHKLVWFASSRQDDLQTGVVAFVTGKIKGHGAFNSVRETGLTRCSVVPEDYVEKVRKALDKKKAKKEKAAA